VFIGISIPQGGGKTTLSNCLESAMQVLNINTGVISYDDLYHTHEDLQKLKIQNPGNIFYEGRGVAGTHDLALGSSVLDQMIYSDSEIEIPRYKKSLNNG
jgi:D-glycerate 3-kinase